MYAVEAGGAPVEAATDRWARMTEAELLAEISAEGDPERCSAFITHLQGSAVLTEQAVQRSSVQRGHASIEAKPADPCAALATCCEAIPDQSAELKTVWSDLLESAVLLGLTDECASALESYRPLCTGG